MSEVSPQQAFGSLSPLPLSLGSAFVASPSIIERLSVIMYVLSGGSGVHSHSNSSFAFASGPVQPLQAHLESRQNLAKW
jgi:hypothetical protein